MMKTKKRKRTIKRRIQLNALTIAVISTFIISFITVFGLQKLLSSISVLIQNSGDAAVAEEKELLESQVVHRMLSVAEAKADTVDSDLNNIISSVEIMSAAAEDLYARPEEYGRIDVPYPEEVEPDHYSAQLILAEWVDPDEAADEIGLLGNLSSIMLRTVRGVRYTTAASIGTESGIIVTCDRHPEAKAGLDHLDPTVRDWYIRAKEAGTVTWSGIFDDAYGRGRSISCAKPVYDPEGNCKGVVTFGCTMADITPSLSDLHIGTSEYAFVIDHEGNIIMSGREEDNASDSVSETPNLLEDPDTDVKKAAQAFTSGEKGVTSLRVDGEEVYAAYVPLTNMDWTVVTVVTTEEALDPVTRGEEILVGLTNDMRDLIRASSFLGLVVILFGFAIAIFAALMISRETAKVITKPVVQLNETVEKISAGDLTTRVDIHTGDEIEDLGNSVNQMADSLNRHIHDLTHMTAERERIQTELSLGRSIQAKLLPHVFPPFPERKEIDLYASMEPAKEVGGDFYDFIMLDEDHLALTIADISGKGVPAALFMMISKTLIGNSIRTTGSPGQTLAQVNNMLCENGMDEMFVTAWLAVVELSTGVMTYANAGHENPLWYHDGKWEYIMTKHGFVLGGMEDMPYADHTLQLEKGDVIFQYTDGLPEASTKEEKLFGDERLLAAAQEADPGDSAGFIRSIRAAVGRFVQDADQFDDMTMLCFRYAADVPADTEPAEDTELPEESNPAEAAPISGEPAPAEAAPVLEEPHPAETEQTAEGSPAVIEKE